MTSVGCDVCRKPALIECCRSWNEAFDCFVAND